jgi:hypothetical protein
MGNAGKVNLALIFGLPDCNLLEEDILPAPHSLPVLLKKDKIVQPNEFSTRWASERVVDTNDLGNMQVSLGIEGV